MHTRINQGNLVTINIPPAGILFNFKIQYHIQGESGLRNHFIKPNAKMKNQVPILSYTNRFIFILNLQLSLCIISAIDFETK